MIGEHHYFWPPKAYLGRVGFLNGLSSLLRKCKKIIQSKFRVNCNNQKGIPGEKLLRGVLAAKLAFFPEFPASKDVSEPGGESKYKNPPQNVEMKTKIRDLNR